MMTKRSTVYLTLFCIILKSNTMFNKFYVTLPSVGYLKLPSPTEDDSCQHLKTLNIGCSSLGCRQELLE